MELRTKLREYGADGLLPNVLALSGVQAVRKTLPVLALPYLARVLGPSGFGLLAFFQSFAACVNVFIEFGFRLSSAREVAQSRYSPSRLGEVVSGVFGAQVVLTAMSIVATYFVSFWIAPLKAHPGLAIAAFLWAVVEGFLPVWYFVGIEKMGLIAMLEIVSKTLATAGVFLLVHSPDDTWWVLLLQAGASGVSWIVALYMIHRRHPIARPSMALAGRSLKAGWPMFIIRGTDSLYTVGNAFLLGALAPAAAVAYFAGPEKISRALFGLFNPIRDVLYPRISHLSRSDPHKATRLARAGTVATIGAGLAIGAGVYLTAPLLIRLALGPGFAEAIPVLRLLAALPVILAVIQSVSLQWLLPQGREADFTRITLVTCIVHVGLVLLWAPGYTHMGMTWSVLSSQTLACALCIATAWKSSFRDLNKRAPAPECVESAG